MKHLIRGIPAAFMFLTRIPVVGISLDDGRDWRWANAHFPLVGLVLGVMLGLFATGSKALVGAAPAAWLTLGLMLMLTGGFHEDGLADTADGMGGAFNRKDLLRIIKDSRVGTYGAAALVLSLGIRAALFVELEQQLLLALIISQSVARLPPLFLIKCIPYVSENTKAKSRDLMDVQWPQVSVGVCWVALVLGVAIYTGGLPVVTCGMMLSVLTVWTVVAGWRFKRRAGGITGDFLGATEQLSEVAILLVLCL